jgi:hypothetical protein
MVDISDADVQVLRYCLAEWTQQGMSTCAQKGRDGRAQQLD